MSKNTSTVGCFLLSETAPTNSTLGAALAIWGSVSVEKSPEKCSIENGEVIGLETIGLILFLLLAGFAAAWVSEKLEP